MSRDTLATAVDIRHVYSEDTHTITLLILPGGPGPINLTLNLCRHNTALNTSRPAVTSRVSSQTHAQRNRAFSDAATVPDSQPPEYPLETQVIDTVPITANPHPLAPQPSPRAMRTSSNATTKSEPERAPGPASTSLGPRVARAHCSPLGPREPEFDLAQSPHPTEIQPAAQPRAASCDASAESDQQAHTQEWPVDSQGLPTTQAMYAMFGLPWPPVMEDDGEDIGEHGWDDGDIVYSS
ncbi:uncharacterized protein C8Q71DRAFT_778174 [Rhodofomes roseus]|uniref:Uncharacterized protein n=1 Tax=Rhodofomes roseus TaxID=34475 RepID=A0ABQ8K6M0_9APHY|nr:uncharacterized protein C8Q71DRAFT_778174 [Rhodofomes roseus]KAH9832262.1 hypothetical protein C8Q71DRAFT_778174 [Rhodofomes roseus]